MPTRALRAFKAGPASRWPLRSLLFAAALATPAVLLAYQLNPLKDRNSGGSHSGFGRSIDTVHEDITHAAIACAQSAGAADATGPVAICREPVRARVHGDPGNIANPLIVGLWWNDDPRQFLHANHAVSAALQWSDAQHDARQVRRSAGRYRQPTMRRLIYRSHFGELQFLHAMATGRAESAAETRQRIMAWLEFTYGVATGAVEPTTTVGRLAPPLRDAFADERSWTVERLFKPRSSLDSLPLGQLALGSMLHLVQDSYSSSHAGRDMTPSAACPNGRVTAFHSFLDQQAAEHRAHDSRSALHRDTATRFSALQNPVEASARLILLVRRRADWPSVVEPWLRSTLFCLDPREEASASAPPA